MPPKSRPEMVKLQLCANAGSAAIMKPTLSAPAIAHQALIKGSQTGNRTDHHLTVRNSGIVERCVALALLQTHRNAISTLQVLDEGASVISHNEIRVIELALGADRKRLAVGSDQNHHRGRHIGLGLEGHQNAATIGR